MALLGLRDSFTILAWVGTAGYEIALTFYTDSYLNILILPSILCLTFIFLTHKIFYFFASFINAYDISPSFLSLYSIFHHLQCWEQRHNVIFIFFKIRFVRSLFMLLGSFCTGMCNNNNNSKMRVMQSEVGRFAFSGAKQKRTALFYVCVFFMAV